MKTYTIEEIDVLYKEFKQHLYNTGESFPILSTSDFAQWLRNKENSGSSKLDIEYIQESLETTNEYSLIKNDYLEYLENSMLNHPG